MRKQLGISSLALLALLFVGIFIGLFCVKVGPLFVNDMFLSQAVASAARSGGGMQKLSKGQIREQLGKTFRVSNIAVNPKDFKIQKANDHTLLTYEYEERVNLFKNIDVIVSFKNVHNTNDN